ncbi:hypothetical protein MNBD_GAMMA15-881 [hydrothermal vent metagenome]|uniref:HMA domain-containing protein n=1 Tax=hydrothermal vent metagenome TaxID=652676 RepID=A0A3B0YFS5_9ZZZZ
MKQKLIALLLMLAVSSTVMAAGTHYSIRVDGLACPYCAYGIEKKLKAIDGVSDIEVDLEAGLVTLNTTDGVSLGEAQMKTLFQDAGFTYRSMTSISGEDEKP